MASFSLVLGRSTTQDSTATQRTQTQHATAQLDAGAAAEVLAVSAVSDLGAHVAGPS